MKDIRVALAGNPNCGKTTIFNRLTRSRQKIGNYPGVTVEKKEGRCRFLDFNISILDLPGVYSLTAHSEEEKITREQLLSGEADVVVNILDASNIERSLYLTTQLMELDIPIILVCNKIDIAKESGIKIDIEKLASYMEVVVVEMVASKGIGIECLLESVVSLSKEKGRSQGIYIKFPKKVERVLKEIEGKIGGEFKKRWKSIKIFEGDPIVGRSDIRERLKEGIAKEGKISTEELISYERHRFLEDFTKRFLESPEEAVTKSDKIDKFLTNRFLGIPIFLVSIYLIFQFTFSVGEYPTRFLEIFFSKLIFFLSTIWDKDTIFRSLVVDGIISGVGSVIVFLPNILLLFIAIAVLEETGYMARAAQMMDRLMHKVGLHGRSFLPMLIGFGCTVPAVMSTRVLDNRRDRITTILILPLICCSAKLAVFTLIIPAFFSPTYSALILFSLYLFGIVLAIVSIKVLRTTVFKGDNIPFIMELPPYQWPSFRNILLATLRRASIYLKKAGTIILAFSLILWIFGFFPIDREGRSRFEGEFSDLQKEVSSMILDRDLRKEFLKKSDKQRVIRGYVLSLENAGPSIDMILERYNRDVLKLKQKKRRSSLYNSYIGRFGRAIEPIFKPLGFDWRIDIALLGALSAKEIFISQLGVIFSLEEGSSEATLQRSLSSAYPRSTGIAVLIFMLISAPCLASVVMTKRETDSWKIAISQFLFLTLFAYLLAFLFQKGSQIILG